MKTLTPSPLPPEILADLEAAARYATTGSADPATLRRIEERAENARKEVLRDFGVQEIGVQIIREMREGR